ncbi:MAG TPA: COX15/CtaA family protein [Pseudonocardiaceae bacterium]|nr:COX15/CtaA family protein [Pseudonocardiaceae bacterium]
MQLSSLVSRVPRPSQGVQRVLAIAAVVTQIGVAVGGGTVRVTGSGLGCPTWPECAPGSLVPIADPTRGQLHQWIEFGNRLLGVSVGVVGALVFIAALLARPRRKRQLWLAASMPLGVVAQAVIGGITVLVKLDWVAVCLHFLPSPVLVWLAVLLVRCVSEGDGPARPTVPRPLRGLLVAMTGVLGVLIAAGTLVTAAGPHSGDANVPRLKLPIVNLAQFHGDFLFIFLGMLVAFGFALRITGGSKPVWRAFAWLTAAVLAQGAIGMIQYFTGVPDGLVILHVFGSMLVTAAMAGLWVATREREGPTGEDYLGGAGRRSHIDGTSPANQP